MSTLVFGGVFERHPGLSGNVAELYDIDVSQLPVTQPA